MPRFTMPGESCTRQLVQPSISWTCQSTPAAFEDWKFTSSPVFHATSRMCVPPRAVIRPFPGEHIFPRTGPGNVRRCGDVLPAAPGILLRRVELCWIIPPLRNRCPEMWPKTVRQRSTNAWRYFTSSGQWAGVPKPLSVGHIDVRVARFFVQYTSFFSLLQALRARARTCHPCRPRTSSWQCTRRRAGG